MFNYSTETIINSPVYKNSMGEVISPTRWEKVDSKYIWIYPDKRFSMSDNTEFKISSIIPGRLPEFATGTISTTIDLATHNSARVYVLFKWDNKPAASYASSFVNKTREYYMPIPKKGVDAALVKHWNTENEKHSAPFVVSLAGTTLTITSIDPFATMKKLSVQVLDFDGDRMYPTGHEIVAETLGTITKAGNSGEGTYQLLVQNNRIPTMELTRFFATLQDEKPEVGALYSKVVVTQKTERTITGKDAVGSVQQSVTDHTFWIKQEGSLVADFHAAITSALTLPVPTPPEEGATTFSSRSVSKKTK